MATAIPKSSLEPFSAATAAWFAATYGEPTAIQALTWPKISRGENLLASAPTGCGKTLAAFLWAIDRLQSGAWRRGSIRVLYISPLKALNNDIHRNLLQPIEQLGADIRVATRSGDTTPAERQRMRKHPPDILITTPESLNILLTSKSGRALFSDLAVVILDEIHAVAGSKRGTHLMTAIERLVPLAGDFQRIALSATVRPIERVATWVAGHRVVQESPLVLEPRPIETVQAPSTKSYVLEVTGIPSAANVEAAAAAVAPDDPDAVWTHLARLVLERIDRNRSTLIFGSGRRAVEKITRLVNQAARDDHRRNDGARNGGDRTDAGPVDSGRVDSDVSYSHHGSLSKEVRNVVEERLKKGRLQAIVATSSLELGIDIGTLDEVIQVQTPYSVASLVQRMGRAGHGVGETSRALLVPMYERDLLGAMVIAKAALDGDLEVTHPLVGGLDVLAQVILSMTATQCLHIDRVYATIRACDAYKDLSREQFEDVLEMLSGRYSNARIRSLDARLLWDKADGTLQAKRGVDRLVYGSGGTIADRGYFQLRLADTKAKLGELDEEFVWERSLGDQFTLGTRAWRIEQITHNDVFVSPAKTTGAMIPFWRAEERDRGFLLAERISEFLAEAEALLADNDAAGLASMVGDRYPVRADAVRDVVRLLKKQRAVCKAALPHRRHLLVEYYRDPHNNQERRQVILHTFWGGQVNRPFAMAIASAWQHNHGHPLEVMHTDDCVVLSLQDGFSLDDILQPVRSDNLTELLRRQLHQSGLFGARFRENAGCALLLPRGDFRRRLPLWLNRMRSKKLLAAVSQHADFPITLETWRACLHEAFDLENLKQLLDELQDRSIEITETYTDTPSPFAKEVVWKHTNEEMYNDDRPEHGNGVAPGENWMREVTLSANLRPQVEPTLTRELEQKLQRTYPGYAPNDTPELLDWVKQRVIIPEHEWLELAKCINADAGVSEFEHEVAGHEPPPKCRWLSLGQSRAIVAEETLQRLPVLKELERTGGPLEDVHYESVRQLLREVMRFYGPRPVEATARLLAMPTVEFARLIAPLVEADEVVVDHLHADAPHEEVCDSQNLETLLRWTRKRRRQSFDALPLERLGLYWACYQGVVAETTGNIEQLGAALMQLATYGAPADAWEKELLPARLRPYHTSWLDTLFTDDELLWRGVGPKKLTFLLPEDFSLLPSGSETSSAVVGGDAKSANEEASEAALLPEGGGRYRVAELALTHARSTKDIEQRLWECAWRGEVSTDSFAAVRQGSLRRFQGPSVNAPRASARGRRRALGKGNMPAYVGAWFRNSDPAEGIDQQDALDVIERSKDRARLLLDRYGVIFREAVNRDASAFRWRDVFGALRLMELSGEVMAGHFFSGIDGLQFASAEGMRWLRTELPDDAVYWVSAIDPACANGLGAAAVLAELPHRRAGGHVVFHGVKPVVVSTAGGKQLTIEGSIDAFEVERYFDFFKHMLTRSFDPRADIEIETINEQRATASPWRAVLASIFDVSTTPRTLVLRKRYTE